jgi:multiple sugar transport system permease protein
MTALRWIVLVLFALLVNAPILATLATSLKPPGEIMGNPGLWVRDPTLANYAQVLRPTDRLNVWHHLWNSLAAATVGAVLPLLLCLPAAYAMARRGWGRRLLLPLVLNLRAIPLIIFALPLYLVYQVVHLLDTRAGLGLILAVVNLPLTLAILVNAVADIPLEIDEAAAMDGARAGRVLRRIILPLCRPALVTAFILGFITAWNEFLFGLMLTTSRAVPMTVGASFFFASGGAGVQWGVAAAVIVVAGLPPVVLGLLMYRQIARAMMAGAVKG